MRVTQQMIADKVGLTQSTVARILSKNPRDTYSQETVQKVLKVAQELGYSISHKRTFARQDINIQCSFQVRLKADRALCAKGTAVISNMSRDGVLLRALQFEDAAAALPSKPFYFELEVPESGLEDFTLKCVPVRIGVLENEIELGLRFFSLQKKRLKVLKEAFNL